MFSTITSKLMLAMGIVIVLLGGAIWYSQIQIGKLHEANGSLKTAIDVQAGTISSLETKFTKQATEIKTLQQSSNAAQVQYNTLVAQLRAYDLINAARANRAEAESKINTDTNAALKELERITGGVQPVQTPVSKPATGGDVQPPPKPPVRTQK